MSSSLVINNLIVSHIMHINHNFLALLLSGTLGHGSRLFFFGERILRKDITNTIEKRTAIIFKTNIFTSLGKFDHQTYESKILIHFFARQSTVLFG